MSQWYFARQGQQHGPVPASELHRLAANGQFDPLQDLVWRDGMQDWRPAADFPELQPRPQPSAVASPILTANPRSLDPSDPYAAPASNWHEPIASPQEEIADIPPGSEPLDVAACIKHSFELTKRHFGLIIATGAVYVGINMAVGALLGPVETLAYGDNPPPFAMDPETQRFTFLPDATTTGVIASIAINIITQIIALYLSLGTTRIGLNIVNGRAAGPAMIFGESSRLPRAIGASILYALMVGLGLVLLVVPGIYLALRYGQYLNAIVDRDMSVMEAFNYSSSITQNNKLPLLVLWLASVLILLAGALALCVGLIFAYPLIWVIGFVAYRWMQVGSAAVRSV